MKRAIQPVVVVIAFAVATAGVARAAAPPFEPFEAAAAGFTIGIPKDWAPFDLSKETQAGVQRALKRAGAEHPDELAAIVPTLRAQGGVLYAVDPKQHDGLNANLNVVRGPLLNRTITDFDQALRAPFKNLKAKAPKIAPVEIDGVAGRKAAGRVKVTTAGCGEQATGRHVDQEHRPRLVPRQRNLCPASQAVVRPVLEDGRVPCSMDERFHLGEVLPSAVIVPAGARLGVHARRAYSGDRIGHVVRTEPTSENYGTTDGFHQTGAQVPVVDESGSSDDARLRMCRVEKQVIAQGRESQGQ